MTAMVGNLVVNDLGRKPCLSYGLQIKVTSNCFVIFEQNCIQNYDSKTDILIKRRTDRQTNKY
jgi:hypothetical protein